MRESVFDVLRSREQLGYDVDATLCNEYGILGFQITVLFQADKFRYYTILSYCRIGRILIKFLFDVFFF